VLVVVVVSSPIGPLPPVVPRWLFDDPRGQTLG
jgi:hypothetical protein